MTAAYWIKRGVSSGYGVSGNSSASTYCGKENSGSPRKPWLVWGKVVKGWQVGSLTRLVPVLSILNKQGWAIQHTEYGEQHMA